MAVPADNSMYQTALDLINDPGHSEIDYESSLKKGPPYRHAGHALIFARQDDSQVLFNKHDCPLIAAVMMQMRFDGTIGFPGGIIDPGEDILQGVNRELSEEIGLDMARYSCTMDDYVSTHCSDVTKWVLHFFAKEVTFEEFKEIEYKALKCGDYGFEVQGLIRVPLFTMDERGRGFPQFLKNNFIGNSRQQLLTALLKRRVMTPEQLINVIQLYSKLNDVSVPKPVPSS